MISIYSFLKQNGIDPSSRGQKIDIDLVEELIEEYSKMVREEQIIYCAVGASYHTAIKVRGVPERLDDDLKDHMNVCRVIINKRKEKN